MSRILAAFGVTQLALGGWMLLAPRSFYDVLADFGPYDGHLLRDNATWYLALGAALLLAARRPAWRAPVLALALLQYALHALNHLADVTDARTALMGVFDVVSLALTAAALVVLLRRSTTPGRPGTRS